MQNLKIGQYQILGKISQGGMAEIYRARKIGPHGFEKIFAIKVILPLYSTDTDFLAMFSSEAKVTAQLQHPNIVQISDFGVEDQTYFIAMEYIHGINLNDLIGTLKHTDKSLPLFECLYVIKSICSAMQYAHFLTDFRGKPLKIVHRDVNPKNIMISYRGEVKLMDFGIALATNRNYKTTADGSIKGKLSYLSPEQIRGLELDHRSDLFSFGIVMYELLTGVRPFQSDTDFGVIKEIEKSAPIPPCEINSDIPEELNAIILKCLTREREDRFQTAREIRDSIEKFEQKSGYYCEQQTFHDFLLNALGEDRVNSPLLPVEDASAQEFEKYVSEQSERDRGTLGDLMAGSSTGTIAAPESDPSSSSTQTMVDSTPVPANTQGLMVQKKTSAWERLRFPLITVIAMIVLLTGVVLVLGVDNVQRLILGPSIFEGQIHVTADPTDAYIELDNKIHRGGSFDIDVKWEINSQKIVRCTHPDRQDLFFSLQPEKGDVLKVVNANRGVELTGNSPNFNLSIKMVPNFRRVAIQTVPPGAKIFIDHVDTNHRTPYDHNFEVDRAVTIRAELDGYESAEVAFKAEAFQEIKPIVITLAKIPEPTRPPVEMGTLLVNAPYPVDMQCGRSKFKNIHKKKIELPVGKYKLLITNPNFALNLEETVVITANRTRVISVEEPGVLIVKPEPEGCEVLIRGHIIGRAPGSFKLAPGTHEVKFQWDRCSEPQMKWITIRSGQNKRQRIKGC